MEAALAGTFAESSERFQFTVGVAEFAEILRESPHVNTSLTDVESIGAPAAAGDDDRDVELLELVRKAQTID